MDVKQAGRAHLVGVQNGVTQFPGGIPCCERSTIAELARLGGTCTTSNSYVLPCLHRDCVVHNFLPRHVGSGVQFVRRLASQLTHAFTCQTSFRVSSTRHHHATIAERRVLADMAQTTTPVAGVKRGPGRPPKSAAPLPASKKLKIAPNGDTSPSTPITLDSPAPQTPRVGLPSKVTANAPLPALPQPQSLDLTDADYQSIAASAVLATSLERSHQAWTHSGVFQRFWTKPEKLDRKDPVYQSMKSRGKCRLRIEPHIFEIELFVVEKPRPPVPKVPKAQSSASAYGGQYRSQQPYSTQGQPHHSYYQNSARPAAGHAAAGNLAPAAHQPAPPAPNRQGSTPQASSSSAAQGQDKKASPDPVISMLATRASSDPELKALMKEVATGKATPDQLRVFQKHIDELTALIQSRKAKEEEEERKKARAKAPPQLDGPADLPPQRGTPYAPPKQAPVYPQQPAQSYVAPPPPAPGEVVFTFTAPGSSEDRFLFPQYSILEPLSPQHVLASFMVTRKGRESADSIHMRLDPDIEYWQPVTLMVEVAYGHEGILKDVTRWVKPAEETREEMKRIMARCTRAPDAFLAVRLPHRSTISAAESEQTSKAGTPVPVVEAKAAAKKAAPRKSILAKESTADKEKRAKSVKTEPPAPDDVKGQAATDSAAASAVAVPGEGGAEANAETTETGRPRRTTRKSVRISEE